jgi:hypothetical protein
MTIAEIKEEVKKRKAKKKLEEILGFPAELEKINQEIEEQKKKIELLKHDRYLLEAFFREWKSAYRNEDTGKMQSLLNVWSKHRLLKGTKLLKACKEAHLKFLKDNVWH